MLENEFDNLVRRQLKNSERNQAGQSWEKERTWKKIESALVEKKGNAFFSKRILFFALALLMLSATVVIFSWESIHVHEDKVIKPIVSKKNKIVKKAIHPVKVPQVLVRKNPKLKEFISEKEKIKTLNEIDNSKTFSQPLSEKKTIKNIDTINLHSNSSIVPVAHNAPAISQAPDDIVKDTIQIKTSFTPGLIEDFRFRNKTDSIRHANTEFLKKYENENPDWKRKRRVGKHPLKKRK